MKKLVWLVILSCAALLSAQTTTTPNVGLQIPSAGSTNWNLPLNFNFNKIDQLFGGNFGGSTVNLSLKAVFGSGAPVIPCSSANEAQSYYNVSTSPYTLYVCHLSSWILVVSPGTLATALTPSGTVGYVWTQLSPTTQGWSTGGAVSSVSNSDGTLTISPTTGSVVASLALGHANTWTAQQTQPSPVFSDLTGSTQCLQVNSSGQVAGTGTACGTGSGGVTSLNSLTGTIAIIAGSGISVTPSGSNIQITNTGSVSNPVQFNPSTTNYVFAGDSRNIQATVVSTTATAVSCNGTVCTITDNQTYVAGQWIAFAATWSPSCLSNYLFAQVLSSGLSSTQFEVTQATDTMGRGCTGTQTGSGGSVWDETYAYPFAAGQRTFFKGHGNIINLGYPSETIQSMVTNYSTYYHPWSPAVTGVNPTYIFVQAGAQDFFNGTSTNTIESLLAQFYALAHTDGYIVVASTILPAPVTVYTTANLVTINNYIASLSPGSQTSTGQYWDYEIDFASVISNYNDLTFYDSGNIHPNNAGAAVMADTANEALAHQDSANHQQVNAPVIVAGSAGAIQYNSTTVTGTLAGLNVTGPIAGNGTGAPAEATGGQLAGPFLCQDVSGSGTSQTCTTTPTFTPVAGSCVIYSTTTANTGTALVISVDGVSGSVAKNLGNTTLAIGDVPANQEQLVCYNGSLWNLSTSHTGATGNICGTGNVPCTNTANTFTTGTQAIQTGTPTTVGITVQGTSGALVPAVVQFKTGTSSTLAFTSSVAAGDAILAECKGFSGTTPSDNNSDSYGTTIYTLSGYYNAGLYLALNVAGGSTTITCPTQAIFIAELSGIVTSSALDGSPVNATFLSSPGTVGALSTSTNDLVITVVDNVASGLANFTTATPTISGTSGFTSTGTGASVSFGFGDAPSGAYTGNWTWAGPSYVSGYIFALKAASSSNQIADLQDWESSSSTVLASVGHDGGFNSSVTQTVVSCATSGTVTFSQPFRGSSYKMAIAYANACVGSASYTYPTAFTNTPEITGALSSIGSSSATVWTVTGTTSTGFLKADGY